MPKKRSKRKSAKNKAKRTSGREFTNEDLTICDFADAKNAEEKLKRISRGHATKSVLTNLVKMSNDDLLWYERDEFDFDQEESTSIIDGGEDNNRETTEIINTQTETRTKHKQKKKKSSKSITSFSGELTYPLDLWYQIAKFLHPEDVLKFSLICRGARAVLNSAKFWLRLYQKHIQEPCKLAPDLRPDRIECRPGLRPRIVRALFQGYDVLKSRISNQQVDSCQDPDRLLYYTCILQWCKQVLQKGDKKLWVFYFKFMERSEFNIKKPERFSPEWFDTVDFVNDNPEEMNCALSVLCSNYIPVVPVLGQVLTEVSIGVSAGVKYSRIKMKYHSYRKDGRYPHEGGVQVTLDPVLDVKVLHWWHPNFPHLTN